MDDGPFDLKMSVASGMVFRWHSVGERTWVGVDGDRWYGIEDRGDGYLEVESNATKADLLSFFRLERRQDELHRRILAIEPRMADYFGAVSGLRLLRPSSRVESLISFLCTPNNHISRITQMVGYLDSKGPYLGSWRGAILRSFPSLSVVANLTEAELRESGFGYRAKNIPRVAGAILDRGGEAWLDELAAGPYARAFEELMQFPGVGPKLADCIALFALHKTEAVPVDTHIWQALTRLYHPEWQSVAMTDLKYRVVAGQFREKFGELSAFAHQALFYENVLNWRTR